ncbi:MAG: response regulator [Planctomycetota bacterium]
MDQYYSIGRIARIMNVARTTVHYWIEHGHLKTFKLPGEAQRITHDQLVAFMNKLEVPLDFIDMNLNRRILIVDDEPETIAPLVKYLKRRSLNVWTTTNGLEAGMFAKQYRPHVIILDIKIAGIDGREVCNTLRNNPELSRVRIIAISGRIPEKEGAQLSEYGFDGYMSKPFDLGDFYTLVKKVMAKRQKRNRWKKFVHNVTPYGIKESAT